MLRNRTSRMELSGLRNDYYTQSIKWLIRHFARMGTFLIWTTRSKEYQSSENARIRSHVYHEQKQAVRKLEKSYVGNWVNFMTDQWLGGYVFTKVIDQVLFGILTACIDSALSWNGASQGWISHNRSRASISKVDEFGCRFKLDTASSDFVGGFLEEPRQSTFGLTEPNPPTHTEFINLAMNSPDDDLWTFPRCDPVPSRVVDFGVGSIFVRPFTPRQRNLGVTVHTRRGRYVTLLLTFLTSLPIPWFFSVFFSF